MIASPFKKDAETDGIVWGKTKSENAEIEKREQIVKQKLNVEMEKIKQENEKQK